MKTKFFEGETLLKKGVASQKKGMEVMTGRLYLTDRRVIFESSLFNVQAGITIIPLPSVHMVEKGWSRSFGFLPTVPNIVRIHTKTGKYYNFALFMLDRGKWFQAIKKELANQTDEFTERFTGRAFGDNR
jgi:hypothetical protein